MGQSASQLRPIRARLHRGHAQRHQRGVDARPVPRMGTVHDGSAHRRGRCMSRSAMIETQLVPFAYREARLIDEKRFAEWFDLFTDDGRYWIPLPRGQPDGEQHTSLMYEDKLLLKVRIERLKNPRSFSQQQPSFCQHVLQAPSIESADAEAVQWVLRTPFAYFESQLDTQICLAGV